MTRNSHLTSSFSSARIGLATRRCGYRTPAAGRRGSFWERVQAEPDGRTTAARSCTESPESGRHIAIADRDGTGRQRLEDQDGVVPSVPTRPTMDLLLSHDSQTGVPHVWKIGNPSRTTDSSTPVQVTRRQGTYSEESHDGAYVYFASSFGIGSIWRVPSIGGKEELVIDEPVHWSNLTVVNDGIYYIAVPPTGSAASSQLYGTPGNALKFFRFADAKTLTIHALPHPAFMGLSVSRDRSSVFLTQVDHQGSDLWVVNGLR